VLAARLRSHMMLQRAEELEIFSAVLAHCLGGCRTPSGLHGCSRGGRAFRHLAIVTNVTLNVIFVLHHVLLSVNKFKNLYENTFYQRSQYIYKKKYSNGSSDLVREKYLHSVTFTIIVYVNCKLFFICSTVNKQVSVS